MVFPIFCCADVFLRMFIHLLPALLLLPLLLLFLLAVHALPFWPTRAPRPRTPHSWGTRPPFPLGAQSIFVFLPWGYGCPPSPFVGGKPQGPESARPYHTWQHHTATWRGMRAESAEHWHCKRNVSAQSESLRWGVPVRRDVVTGNPYHGPEPGRDAWSPATLQVGRFVGSRRAVSSRWRRSRTRQAGTFRHANSPDHPQRHRSLLCWKAHDCSHRPQPRQ